MRTLLLTLLTMVGIALGTTTYANESAVSVFKSEKVASTQIASASSYLEELSDTGAGVALTCKKRGEKCEEHDECCKWPVWLSCVWGKCGEL